MRKRRRLANKLTIMMCAVLIAFSAFFYAPMEVDASSPNSIIEFTGQSDSRIFSNNVSFYVGGNGSSDVQNSITDFEVLIPLALSYWNGGNIFCDGNSLFFYSNYTFVPEVSLVSSTGSFSYDCSITGAELCFNNQSVDLSTSKYVNAIFDSSVCNGLNIASSFYIRLTGVFSCVGVSSDSWLNFSFSVKLPENNVVRIIFYDNGFSSSEDLNNQTDEINENNDKNTDTIVNGFDDSSGSSMNSGFESGLNDYTSAEDSLFQTASTGMQDFSFFDISSVPAMVTGLSFVSSVMTSWFNQAGGASGVGIVLSILFSVMLVSMALGLYRFFQSKGGKD